VETSTGLFSIMNEQIYEEDVQGIVLTAIDTVERELQKLGIKLTTKDNDAIYDALLLPVEMAAGQPLYRNQN